MENVKIYVLWDLKNCLLYVGILIGKYLLLISERTACYKMAFHFKIYYPSSVQVKLYI